MQRQVTGSMKYELENGKPLEKGGTQSHEPKPSMTGGMVAGLPKAKGYSPAKDLPIALLPNTGGC